MATRPQYPRNRNGRISKPPQRSNSVLGRLKSLLFNPFGAWVGSDIENEQGKRPRHAEVGYGTDQDDESGRRSKRKRLDHTREESDQLFEQPTFRPVTNGYLEPPQDMFNRPPIAKPIQRASSLVIPSSTSKHQAHQNGHYSLSPQPTASLRAMRPILEETNETSRRSDYVDATYVPLPLSRDVSMESIGGPVRDSSKSPSRARFRMRTSMTPQPTGQSFGPSRKERERSEPPPLASLAARPMFVKPPTQLSTVAEEPTRHSTVPLGSVAGTYRGNPPARQRSVLSLTRQLSDIEMAPVAPQRPVIAAEKALQELDLYRTPLLPSRLRGSPSIPDMFKPKPVHSLTVVHDDRDDIPRLGTSDKQSAKRKAVKSKPYEGTGGVKKLLERRKREEIEEKEKEKEATIVTDAEEEALTAEKKVAELPKEKVRENEESVPERRGFSVVPNAGAGGRERSSLRVGRSKTNVYREASASRSKRGFSARYDEDDADNEEEEENQAPKLPPMFQPPANFSFANNVSPIKHDVANAKEPPIAALPFSLSPSKTPTNASSTPETSKPSTPSQEGSEKDKLPAVAVPAASVPVSAPAPPTPLFATAPAITLVPPTPGPSAIAAAPAKPAESQLGAATSGSSSSSIPNFFANSALINKAPAPLTAPFVLSHTTPTTIPSLGAGGSLFGAPPKPFGSEIVPPTAPNVPQTSLFGNTTSAPSLASAAPIQEKEKAAGSIADAEKPPTSSLFGSAPTGGELFDSLPQASITTPASVSPPAQPISAFSFSAPKPAEPTTAPAPAPAPAFNFAAPPKPAEPSADITPKTSLPFSFGAPAKQAEEAPKPPASLPFSFGAPKTEEPKPIASTPSPAPLFGTPTATSSTTTELSKAPFTFGQPAASTAAPTIEAPKPLFGTGAPAFGFGQQSTSLAPEQPKSPFTFGASPSPAPPSATENKPAPFTFGSTPSPAPPAAPSLFGAPSTSNEQPKSPFAFGAPSTPVRPVTPPQKDNEVAMDESPTRSVMDVNGKQPSVPPFSFTSSPFGQPSTPTNNTTAPFSFGAPSSNPFGAKPADPKPEVKPPATAFPSFGSTTGNGFSFSKPAEPARPSSASGAFSFSQPSVPPINTTPSFGFGPSTSNTNAFGASSTPASPSTFNQPSSFAFGSQNPTPASATNPFAFGGSQPASPATSNAGLPSASGASPFAFGTPTNTTGPSFGSSPAPSPGGGPQFTLGAAPPQPAAAGGRQIKKLPSRTRGKR